MQWKEKDLRVLRNKNRCAIYICLKRCLTNINPERLKVPVITCIIRGNSHSSKCQNGCVYQGQFWVSPSGNLWEEATLTQAASWFVYPFELCARPGGCREKGTAQTCIEFTVGGRKLVMQLWSQVPGRASPGKERQPLSWVRIPSGSRRHPGRSWKWTGSRSKRNTQAGDVSWH